MKIISHCSPHLSTTGNKLAYGRCNDASVHSHEYTIDVTTRGAVSSSIGTVMSLSDLKRHVASVVLDQLHGRNLNTDVDYFRRVVIIV